MDNNPQSTVIAKTLRKRAQDLDDQLFLLAESASKAATGDEVYFKQVATSLRNLVNEKLLWNTANLFHIRDKFEVPVLELNTPPTSVPLRKWFERPAIYVGGNGYSHYRVIQAFANQIGLAHEDPEVETFVIVLSNVILGGKSAAHRTLLVDATHVLDAGKKALDLISQQLEFDRRVYNPPMFLERFLSTGETVTKPLNQDYEATPANLVIKESGSYFFIFNHPNSRGLRMTDYTRLVKLARRTCIWMCVSTPTFDLR